MEICLELFQNGPRTRRGTARSYACVCVPSSTLALLFNHGRLTGAKSLVIPLPTIIPCRFFSVHSPATPLTSFPPCASSPFRRCKPDPNRGLCGAGSVTLPGATLPHGAALGPNTRLAGSDTVREGALHLGSPAPIVAGRYAPPPRTLSVLEKVLYFGAPLPLAALSTAITLSAAFWPLLGLSRAADALGGAGTAWFLTPFAWLGLGCSLALTGAAAKWLIIGRQHPSDTRYFLYRLSGVPGVCERDVGGVR